MFNEMNCSGSDGSLIRTATHAFFGGEWNGTMPRGDFHSLPFDFPYINMKLVEVKEYSDKCERFSLCNWS